MAKEQILSNFLQQVTRHALARSDSPPEKKKITITPEASVEGTVGIGTLPTGFGLEVELKISLPGVPRDQASKPLVDKAHVVCPYSECNSRQHRRKVDLGLS